MTESTYEVLADRFHLPFLYHKAAEYYDLEGRHDRAEVMRAIAKYEEATARLWVGSLMERLSPFIEELKIVARLLILFALITSVVGAIGWSLLR